MSLDQTSFQRFDAERSTRLAAGLASPLWATFFAAAGAGVAFWWATGWTRRQLAAVPSFADAETKSFAPAANDAEVAAPEAVMEHVEPEATPFAAEPQAPTDAEAIMDHQEPEDAPSVSLVAAEEALADTQAEVAQLAAQAATEELAARPRRGKKA